MKTLNIQFDHPVKGRIQLREKRTKTVKTLRFKSDEDFSVNICPKELTDGDWSASIEWDHQNRPFLIQRHFRITDKKIDSSESY